MKIETGKMTRNRAKMFRKNVARRTSLIVSADQAIEPNDKERFKQKQGHRVNNVFAAHPDFAQMTHGQIARFLDQVKSRDCCDGQRRNQAGLARAPQNQAHDQPKRERGDERRTDRTQHLAGSYFPGVPRGQDQDRIDREQEWVDDPTAGNRTQAIRRRNRSGLQSPFETGAVLRSEQ